MSRKSKSASPRRARKDETIALEPVLVEAPAIQAPVEAPAAEPALVDAPVVVIEIETPALDALVAESEYGPEILPMDDPRWKSSVVPAKYRRRYASHDESCGDSLAKDAKAFLTVETEDGPKLDLGLLVRWAEANGVWVEAYTKLNPGMQRMNCCNRLRAKMRKGHTVDWNVQ